METCEMKKKCWGLWIYDNVLYNCPKLRQVISSSTLSVTDIGQDCWWKSMSSLNIKNLIDKILYVLLYRYFYVET